MKLHITCDQSFFGRFILRLERELIEKVTGKKGFDPHKSEVQFLWEGEDITEQAEAIGWDFLKDWVKQGVEDQAKEVSRLKYELEQTKKEIAVGYLEEKIPGLISKLDDLERDLWQILPEDEE